MDDNKDNNKGAVTLLLETDPPIYLNQEMAFELLSSVVRKKLLALKAPKWMNFRKAVQSLHNLFDHLSDDKLDNHAHMD